MIDKEKKDDIWIHTVKEKGSAVEGVKEIRRRYESIERQVQTVEED